LCAGPSHTRKRPLCKGVRDSSSARCSPKVPKARIQPHTGEVSDARLFGAFGRADVRGGPRTAFATDVVPRSWRAASSHAVPE
jgi:hypothetical protein